MSFNHSFQHVQTHNVKTNAFCVCNLKLKNIIGLFNYLLVGVYV